MWPRIWNKTTKLDMKYSNKYSRKKVSNLTWNSYCYVTILDCLYFFHRITCSRCVTPTKTDWASWTWTGKTLLPSCLINLVCSPPSVTPRMFHTLMTSEIFTAPTPLCSSSMTLYVHSSEGEDVCKRTKSHFFCQFMRNVQKENTLFSCIVIKIFICAIFLYDSYI